MKKRKETYTERMRWFDIKHLSKVRNELPLPLAYDDLILISNIKVPLPKITR